MYQAAQNQISLQQANFHLRGLILTSRATIEIANTIATIVNQSISQPFVHFGVGVRTIACQERP